jgi:AcrR family transcriptional regulator
VTIHLAEDRTRTRILDAAGPLLVRAPRSSLADVAAAAGVGRTTVHRCFATREALLDALAVAAVARIEDAVRAAAVEQGPAAGALQRLVVELLAVADEFAFAGTAQALALPELSDAWEDLDRRLCALVDRGKESGEFRTDLSTPFVVDALAGLLEAAGASVAEGRTARRTAATDVLRLLLEGLAR